MTDQRTGIDLLRRVVGEVADSLPSSPRPAFRGIRPLAWILVGAAIAAGAIVIGRLPHREPPPRAVVEVLSLRFRGRDARVRVVESVAAGSIVLVPESTESARSRAEGGVQ